MLDMLGMTDLGVGMLCSGFLVLCSAILIAEKCERISTQGKQSQGKTVKIAAADKCSLYVRQWLMKVESRSRLGPHGCTSPGLPQICQKLGCSGLRC